MGCYQTLIAYISIGNCTSELIFVMRASLRTLHKNMASYPIISKNIFVASSLRYSMEGDLRITVRRGGELKMFCLSFISVTVYWVILATSKNTFILNESLTKLGTLRNHKETGMVEDVRYQTRETEFPRRESKIRRAAEYFWRNSQRSDSRWNTSRVLKIHLLNRNINSGVSGEVKSSNYMQSKTG